MCIPVVLKNGKEELVSKDKLQYLIVTRQVLFFKRSNGWAVIGLDKMRDHQTSATEEDQRKHDVYATDY